MGSARPRAIDLFCGAGGMSLGFEQAGFDIILGVDVDGHHIAAHARNFPTSRTHCGSVAELSRTRIRDLSGWGGEVDLIFGGPPCQGFSHMGLRDHRDPRNDLVGHFVRLVVEIQPKAFVMENVPGMISRGMKPVLDAAVRGLERGGYSVRKPIRTLNAADFGVPQMRSRVFVIGVRSDIGEPPEYPLGLPESPLRPTVIEAIADLPDVELDDLLFSRDIARFKRLPENDYARVARGLLADPTDRSVPRVWDARLCSGCMRTRHTASSVRLYEATLPGAMVPGHKLPRLDPSGICPTLRAGSDSGRGSYTSPRPIHPLLPRCITAREAARLHGYPDWFSFYPTKWHAYKQIGNSVCPPVARAIGSALIESLGVRVDKPSCGGVDLFDVFVLPASRKKQSPRIPQLREFPGVIDLLFRKAYSVKKGRIVRARFSFADVQSAIREADANLPWVRSDTFLPEIARSRNVEKILALPFRHGFSVRPLHSGDFIGEFVPIGSANAIERKNDTNVRIEELASAKALDLPAALISDLSRSLETLLNCDEMRKAIWPATVRNVLLGQELERDRKAFALQIRTHSGRCRPAVALLGSRGNLPQKARIARAASTASADDALVVVPLTLEHLAVRRFGSCRVEPIERRRAVFVFEKAARAEDVQDV